jgi:hypothetical protein
MIVHIDLNHCMKKPERIRVFNFKNVKHQILFYLFLKKKNGGKTIQLISEPIQIVNCKEDERKFYVEVVLTVIKHKDT